MSKNYTVTLNGQPHLLAAEQPLSTLFSMEKPCGGHGKCGKCKILARGNLSPLSEAERRLLTEEERSRGVRLACLTYATGDCEAQLLPKVKNEHVVTDGHLPPFEFDPTFADFGVSMDIGTTTLAAKLFDSRGRLLATDSRTNPQQEWGADVVSRVEAALGGKAENLAVSIRSAINESLLHLCETAEINPQKIDRVVITGNSVMLSLLVGESVKPFSRVPFAVKRWFGETLCARELSLSALAPDTAVYLPPLISAFVGADITCALLSSRLCQHETALLLDIGTNGEIALWHQGELTVCSTAAGPAFEGVGISMGMRCADGAIDKVEAVGAKLFPHVISNGPPVGICGSGLVDAAAVLLQIGILDESGCLEDDPVVLLPPVSVNGQDIRQLQLAKGAVCAGVQTLLESRNLSPEAVKNVFIAGGFGHYLNKRNAAAIGLLPKALAQNATAVGNAALSGASLLLLDKTAQKEAEALAQKGQVLELAANRIFSERFMDAMSFETF